MRSPDPTPPVNWPFCCSLMGFWSRRAAGPRPGPIQGTIGVSDICRYGRGARFDRCSGRFQLAGFEAKLSDCPDLRTLGSDLTCLVRSVVLFDVGDKVVYPHHGAAVVERREVREAFGTSREYLVLKLAYGDLTLMVPADNTDEVGLREVINDEEVEEVFAVLRKKEARMPTNWSRRYKNHVEKLKSGDIYQVAEVVRNLSIRDKDKGLSAGEKRMLTKARQILVSELTFAIGVSEDEAEERLNAALP
jgi:CarD family transcriptional regulator